MGRGKNLGRQNYINRKSAQKAGSIVTLDGNVDYLAKKMASPLIT